MCLCRLQPTSSLVRFTASKNSTAQSKIKIKIVQVDLAWPITNNFTNYFSDVLSLPAIGRLLFLFPPSRSLRCCTPQSHLPRPPPLMHQYLHHNIHTPHTTHIHHINVRYWTTQLPCWEGAAPNSPSRPKSLCDNYLNGPSIMKPSHPSATLLAGCRMDRNAIKLRQLRQFEHITSPSRPGSEDQSAWTPRQRSRIQLLCSSTLLYCSIYCSQ